MTAINDKLRKQKARADATDRLLQLNDEIDQKLRVVLELAEEAGEILLDRKADLGKEPFEDWRMRMDLDSQASEAYMKLVKQWPRVRRFLKENRRLTPMVATQCLGVQATTPWWMWPFTHYKNPQKQLRSELVREFMSHLQSWSDEDLKWAAGHDEGFLASRLSQWLSDMTNAIHNFPLIEGRQLGGRSLSGEQTKAKKPAKPLLGDDKGR